MSLQRWPGDRDSCQLVVTKKTEPFTLPGKALPSRLHLLKDSLGQGASAHLPLTPCNAPGLSQVLPSFAPRGRSTVSCYSQGGTTLAWSKNRLCKAEHETRFFASPSGIICSQNSKPTSEGKKKFQGILTNILNTHLPLCYF